jgi:hypothetical protein
LHGRQVAAVSTPMLKRSIVLRQRGCAGSKMMRGLLKGALNVTIEYCNASYTQSVRQSRPPKGLVFRVPDKWRLTQLARD